MLFSSNANSQICKCFVNLNFFEYKNHLVHVGFQTHDPRIESGGISHSGNMPINLLICLFMFIKKLVTHIEVKQIRPQSSESPSR